MRRWTSSGETGTPALHRLWRTVGPVALETGLAEALNATVVVAYLDAGRVGSTPVEGPQAVCEAQAAIARCGLPHPDTDVAITAVLARAVRGDPDAARFIAEALDLLASTEGGGTHHARFARAWRARSGHSPTSDDPAGK